MSDLRRQLGNIIFEHNTIASRLFDIVLLCAILLSVLLVMLDSVASLKLRYGEVLRTLEWVFTILFTIEYVLRIYTAYDHKKYLFSFFGIVDLLAIIPSYLSLFLLGSQYLIIIRALRLLRIFRVLKLVQFMGEASVLSRALKASRVKIIVFLVTVITLVIIFGSIMFLVEGPENGFDNIPESVYWTIVTLTTVGYGDIAPKTPFGRFLAAMIMILGYAIIAVPTGIVSVELSRADREVRLKPCTQCGQTRHDTDARYCKTCGTEL